MSAPSSNVVALSGRTSSCPDAAISAAIESEHKRHAAALEALYAQRAGMRAGALGGVPVAERRHALGQAAGVLKMNERKLMRLIVRYHELYEDRPKLAVQPAGMKRTQWTVYTDRVQAVIDSGEPL